MAELKEAATLAYYPSMVMHFVVKFDDSFQVDASSEPQGPANPTPREATATSSSRQLQPLVVAPGKLTSILNVVPKRCSLELPGTRQAGRFSATLDFRDLPIDPRFLRGAGVEIYLGTVPASDFARGMLNEVVNGRRPSVLPTRVNGLPDDSTRKLVGSVDTWSVVHGPEGSEVTIEGRDNRGQLLDAKFPLSAIAGLDLSKPIDHVIQQIFEKVPADVGLRIEIEINEADFGGKKPIPADPNSLNRVRKGAKGTKPRAQPAGDKISYWDLVTRMCFLVGAVPHLVGNRLRIVPARSLYAQLRDTPNNPTPFIGGTERLVNVEDDEGTKREERLRVRRLVYGRDIMSVSYERKYGPTSVPVVKVVGTDDEIRGKEKLLQVQWPPEGSHAEAFAADPIFVPVAGIRDLKRLQAIAQDIYEEIGRGEMGGACETRKLTSFGGDNADPDLTRLLPGDAVEFLVDKRSLSSRAPLVSELTDSERRSFDEQVKHVQSRFSRGAPEEGDENLARVLVATARASVVRGINFFRVSNVKYDWDIGSGLGVAFDFQNYVEVAHQQPYVEAKDVDQPTSVITARSQGKARGEEKSPGRGTDRGGDEGASMTLLPGKGIVVSRNKFANPQELRKALRSAGASDAEIASAIKSVFGA